MPSELVEYRRGRERANAHLPLTRTHSIEVNGGAAMQSNAVPEEWRPVVGYEGRYEVSSRGNVRSLTRKSDVRDNRGIFRTINGRTLRQIVETRPGGYRTVMLFKDGKSTRCRVHALVCEAFHGPRPDGHVTRHFDGDPANNDSSNLCWGTCVENSLDMIRHGRNHLAKKTHCPKGHPYSGSNLIISRRRNGTTFRACKACQAEYQRTRRARKGGN